MKISKLKVFVVPERNGNFLSMPKHTFEDIDFELDNFFLGLKLYSRGDAIGLRYMLGAFHNLAFCKDDFETFIKKAVDKYRTNIDSKIVEVLCNKKK
ncbi:MAG: hypothetical protein WCZ90_12815 [Melioribacteraceae bacterium]